MTAPAQSSAQGLPQEPAKRTRRQLTHWPARTCPECLTVYEPHHALQLHCSVAHRDTFNNRIAVRARVIGPLDMVARLTREGTRGKPEDRATGRRAASDRNALIQRWAEEDRQAGRMPWPEYLRLRYAIGFDPLT